ncbi:MAG: VOC family protein [Candidatus Lokiarchaeota archaeon]|nr:VOC family protein [Candidatus Lokiarchaeota archaeon]
MELIQLIDGDCLYKEFLDQGKQGLQHIGIYVENVQQSVDDFEKMLIKSIQTGRAVRHLFAYMDTKDFFGLKIELLELVRRKRKY